MAWKIATSDQCSALFVAPGNPGTALVAENISVELNDFDGIAGFCRSSAIDMLIVGPEEPLVKGLVDFLRKVPGLEQLKIIGPSKEGAMLEGSKAYAKAFMNRHNIPTAAYAEFTKANFEEGRAYLESQPLPLVLKADGLAAGKGVVIAETRETALAAFTEMLIDHRFGEAGNKVVVESFLSGIELSVFVVTDGSDYVILPEAKDYKRIGEGDKGLNTGGMGAVSPVPFADELFMKLVEERVIAPTVNGLREEAIDYTGFIFFGLISVKGEPFVIEYNCRMGDPETEVVMPRLKSDLISLLNAAAEKQLGKVSIDVDQRSCCTIVAVSGGYPGDIKKGIEISGLDGDFGDSILFHSGTKSQDGRIVTNGGRVLCMSSYGRSIETAAKQSSEKLKQISFDGIYFRKDIGYEFPDENSN
jgi:phosphoribosylamine--glycine ligase